MRIEDLDSLVWIARLGSFTAAADRLNVTQPGITRRIKELEAGLGVTLFRRQGRQALLTSEGYEVLRCAEEIVHRWQQLRTSIGAAESHVGSVRIGCGELFAGLWLQDFVERTEAAFPRLELDFDFDVSDRHVAAFNANALDLLLLPGEPPVTGTARRLGEVAFVWAARAGTGTVGALGQHDIATRPLMALSPDSNGYRMAMRWFREGGVQPDRVRFVGNMTLLMELVAAGKGTALIPEAEVIARQDRLMALPTRPARLSAPIWAVSSSTSALPLARLTDLAAACHDDFQRRLQPEDDEPAGVGTP